MKEILKDWWWAAIYVGFMLAYAVAWVVGGWRGKGRGGVIITSIKPRKDGKFLVGLHYRQGTNLRKVLTQEELNRLQLAAKIEEDRERQYRAGKEQE